MAANNTHLTPPRILFVGNGSYQNRGCEAIVRGTMEILRQCLYPQFEIEAGSYGDSNTLRLQAEREIDPAINNFQLAASSPRWSRRWLEAQANTRTRTRFAAQHAPLKNRAKSCEFALEVGGDNYSLDYGIPRHLLAMDNYLRAQGIPVVIWGASIGPFHSEPAFEQEIFSHLRQIRAVFVRESLTYKYLTENGVTDNVHLVADPAFMMEQIEPDIGKVGFEIPDGCIGLNFSPLVGKSFLKSPKPVWELTNEELIPWFDFCVACVLELSSSTGRPILLVPHVSSSLPGIDDFSFLERICRAVAHKATCPVLCIGDNLNAAESKWVISKCAVFAGARTHATIAGFSTHVPTLSFGYSVKAKGINQDIYGNQDQCLDVNNIGVSQAVAAIQKLIERESELRAFLKLKMPEVRSLALSSGEKLKHLLSCR
jgi:colanic acid/amylovoran biosynthesis protein